MVEDILKKIIAEETGAGLGVDGAFGAVDGYDTEPGNLDARMPNAFFRRKNRRPIVTKRRKFKTMNKLTESIVNPVKPEVALGKILSEGDETARAAMYGTPVRSKASLLAEKIKASQTLDECKTLKGKLAAKKAAIAKAKAAKDGGKEDGAKGKLMARKQKLREAIEAVRNRRSLAEGKSEGVSNRRQKLREAIENLRQKRLVEARTKRIEAAKKRILEARRRGAGSPLSEGKKTSRFGISGIMAEARESRLRKQRLAEARERLIEAKKKVAAKAPIKEEKCPKCKTVCDAKTGKCKCVAEKKK